MPTTKQQDSSANSSARSPVRRNQLWTDISHAAHVAKCFPDSDYDSHNELDAELLKFQLVWTFTMKKHKSYNTTAQSVDWLPLSDKTWELAFTKEAADGKKRRRQRPGIKVVGVEQEKTDDEEENEDELSTHWQVVDADEIPPHGEIIYGLDNLGRQRACCVM